MRRIAELIFTLAVIIAATGCGGRVEGGDPSLYEYSTPQDLFEKGNLAMFIHWGPSSRYGGVWNGKNYYGISEWLMHTADISAEDYIEAAREFNPSQFDAQKIVDLAKAVGMKYIVITSKHHDGFAMYHSDCNSFNIVDHTSFGRDPLKELADACHASGLGIGFYYSHCIDWTAPGGNDSRASAPGADFHTYFKEKCYPQVNEITTKYGDLVMVWFDCAGGDITDDETRALAELVHKNQPNAFVSSRIGMGYGDFESGDDMDVVPCNMDGRWESIDTTNDSWGYNSTDINWKSPKEMLERILSTIARGGTYMFNIGPDGNGNVPELCVESLTEAGSWIHRYPQVVYDVEASPWNQTLPWGDAVRRGDKTYLLVYDWPASGELELYGLAGKIKSARLLKGDKASRLKFNSDGDWTTVRLPADAPEKWVSVVELTMNSAELPLIKEIPVSRQAGYEHLSPLLAQTSEGRCVEKHPWSAKFGEWHIERVVKDLCDGGSASWTFAVKDPGYYNIGLRIVGGDDREVFKVSTDEGCFVENERFAAGSYEYRPIGWIKFGTPGIHTVTVTMPEGGSPSTELAGLSIQPVDIY